jgi:hypothetical protein
MNMRRWVATVILMAWMTQAGAMTSETVKGGVTGAQLMRAWEQGGREEKPNWEGAFYFGFVTGVAEVHRGRVWCNPGGVSTSTLAAEVGLYLEKHYALARLSGQDAVRQALESLYPCRQ